MTLHRVILKLNIEGRSVYVNEVVVTHVLQERCAKTVTNGKMMGSVEINRGYANVKDWRCLLLSHEHFSFMEHSRIMRCNTQRR